MSLPMTSSPPPRRIASHRLFSDGRWFFRAWVEVDAGGRVTAQGSWDDRGDKDGSDDKGARDSRDSCDARGGLDRMPCTEFYGGILLCGHYEIRMEAFMKEGLSLVERLATLHCTKKEGLTLLEGIDLLAEKPLRPRLRRIV